MKSFTQFIGERIDDLTKIRQGIDNAVKNQSDVAKELRLLGIQCQPGGEGLFGYVIKGTTGRELVLKVTVDDAYEHYIEMCLKHNLSASNPLFPKVYYVSGHGIPPSSKWASGSERKTFALIEHLQIHDAHFKEMDQLVAGTKEGKFLIHLFNVKAENGFMRSLLRDYLAIVCQTPDAEKTYAKEIIACAHNFCKAMKINVADLDNFCLTMHKMFPEDMYQALDIKADNVGYRGGQPVFFDPIAFTSGSKNSLGGQ